MPTVEVILGDLQRLVGVKLPKEIDGLNDILSHVKGEVESLEQQEVKIEIKDGNRPDLWNVEGIARELRGALGVEEGLEKYAIEADSGVEVNVDSQLQNIRPYIACAVVKGVVLSDEVIRGLVHLQDKLDQTYGRKRRRASIGLYNFDLITQPIRYGVAKPTEVSFVPLDSTEKMTLKAILERHPKGLEYSHIVKEHHHWPTLIDSRDKVLSFPPIINSNDLGKITEDLKNVLVEVTGTVHQTVLNTLTIVTLSLADREGKICSARINYPHEKERTVVTPQLKTKTMLVETDHVNKTLGLDLKTRTIVKLLKKARYEASKVQEDSVNVIVPCYRVDVMHPVDVIEDIAIVFGYNNIEPRWPQLATIGETSRKEVFSDLVREIMVGLGFQEFLSFSMNNLQNLFEKMNLEQEPVVEVANPRTSTYTCLRSWLTPSLMEFLNSNTHVDYPQKIFETGDCVIFDESSETGTTDVRKLACLTTHPNSSFSEAKATLDSLLLNIGVKYEVKETDHASFIEGRAGKILVGGEDVGIIGEISPRVLEEWKLENPTAGFEINLDRVLKN